MKRVVLGSVLIVSVGLTVHCGSDPDCAETRTCAAPGGDGGPGDGSTVDVPVPPGCDAEKEPKDAPACVVDGFGVFVDGAAGLDANPGTKAAPFKTVGAAVAAAGGRRVYVCEGTYGEAVKVTSAVRLYGGFACGGWSYSGARPRIAPSAPGVALSVRDVAGEVVVSDVAIAALDARERGASSVALFAVRAADLRLTRVDLEAGKGGDGRDADAPPSNHFAGSLEGNPSTAATGGETKTCPCTVYGSSTGGGGGAAGSPVATPGSPGIAMPLPAVMGARSSVGGNAYTSATGICTGGFSGSDGAARGAGTGASSRGVLTPDGWSPAGGTPGETANPGAGGGGGGGGAANGSGGGGCGGCGGSGGLSGGGGGASVALLAFETNVSLVDVNARTAGAGRGGNGSQGQAGAAGGGAGSGVGGGCGGGLGGNGAGGSGGGGGAGGVSAAVLRKGGSLSGTPNPSLGAKGTAGQGGAPGDGGQNVLGTAPAGAQGTPGIDGLAEPLVELP